ncbi:alpha/beta fold hydrolase [uncultured Shewanella sp.]|uniref:alpha/beta hydrolase n=1 Tax=uncultured Shewanella sp. TaxID=173975 RepID=UPI00263684F2|nr:alpha/beta fold hydrolase [uncultured Shewanella sp.]
MDRIKTLLFIFIPIIVIGCQNRNESPNNIVAKASSEADYAIMEVFFATDRKQDDMSNMKSYFGAERGVISYGKTKVSIPRDHRMGELESPSIWRFEFSEDAKDHIVLLAIEPLKKEIYFDLLTKEIGSSSTNNAFIFVHGYNVTFEDAARRTAQMSYDLGFDGAPIFYSWPSHGSIPKYTFDEANIQWAENNIKNFLADVLTQTSAENIYLIAHSMGNRALTRAYINVVKENPSVRSRIREVILAAPDIDAEVFKREIAPALVEAKRPITLYASSKDVPLNASKLIHGGYPRAGDTGENIIVFDGIETIDATSVETGFLGHSYYADERSLIADMFYIIHNNLRAKERAGLLEQVSDDGVYWIFRQ